MEGSKLKKTGTIWVWLEVQQSGVHTVSEVRQDVLFLGTEVSVALRDNGGSLERSQTATETYAQENSMQLFEILFSRLGKLKVESLEPVVGTINEVAKVCP